MAMVLDFFVSKFLSETTSFVEGEICKVLGVKQEIQTLEERLRTIRVYLQDAERKRRGSPVIEDWVRKMKDVMYDADDIIDLCMIEGGKLLEARPSDSAVCFPFSFVSSCFQCTKNRHEIAIRIEELNKRLKQIAENNSIMSGLQPTTQVEYQAQTHDKNSGGTSPLEDEAGVVGEQIEVAANNLIEAILKNDKKCSVFGIVGMGGIGKSTLARKIYNDESIKENFPIRKWLYISQKYSETELLKELIRCAGEKPEGGETKAETFQGKSREELETKLASLLTKNLFLVLDDVWSVKVWENVLKKPIIKGVASTKILVTTRDEIVAKSMKASIIPVEKMDEDSGWNLLRRLLFEDGEDDEIHGLEGIGMKIVKKCDGLPLAIKAIAGVLRPKLKSKGVWEEVLERDSWNMNQINEELPGALNLSYEDLPSHLKQCFRFCSLYPEKSEMYYKEIVRFWVAEGLILEKDGKSMEDLGEDYYEELVWRNLLQVNPEYVGKNYFSMHDHLRSLGAYLNEDEGVSIRHRQRLPHTTKVRRLSVSNMGNILELPDEIMKDKCLRTLIVTDSPQTRTIHDNVFRSLPLRVLDLTNTSIERIPDSIEDLLHLRYLDLDGTNIDAIPETIGNLVNLQALNISDCVYLHRLPKAITRLRNLRCLDVEGTPLTHVPKGIGKLENLNHLQGFVIGHNDPTNALDKGCDLEELQNLIKLRCLSIHRLERAVAAASALAGKPRLRELTLSWMPEEDEEDGDEEDEEDGDADDSGDDGDVDDDNGDNNGDQNDEDAEDDDGDEEEDDEDEEEGDEDDQVDEDDDDENEDNGGDDDDEEEEEEEDKRVTLSEEQIEAAEKICDELSPPSSLEHFTFNKFPGRKFPSWMMLTSLDESFPNLQILYLGFIPSCTELPPLGMLPQLKFLDITGANAIKTIGPEFLGHRFPGSPAFPKLEELQFEDMPNWEEWSLCKVSHGEHLKLLPNLKVCFLINCPKLRSLPEDLSHATNLKELYLRQTHSLTEITKLPLSYKLEVTENKMLRRISNLSGVKYLEVDDCPRLEDVDINLEALHHLVLFCPEKMKQLPQWVSGLIEQRQGTPSAQSRTSFRKFELQCNSALLKSCLKGNKNWHIIQQIPDVKIQSMFDDKYIRYTKDPYKYNQNVILQKKV